MVLHNSVTFLEVTTVAGPDSLVVQETAVNQDMEGMDMDMVYVSLLMLPFILLICVLSRATTVTRKAKMIVEYREPALIFKRQHTIIVYRI